VRVWLTMRPARVIAHRCRRAMGNRSTSYFLAQKSLSVEPRWRIKQTLPERRVGEIAHARIPCRDRINAHRRYCFFFTVVDSVVVVFTAGALGSAGSAGFTSELFVVLVDSDVVLGGGAGAAVGAGTAAVGAGVCSQPVSVSPKAIRANAAKHL
jgi:hypothetical protein